MIPGVAKGVARVFLGVPDRSDELNAGTERGLHKVRTLRRREATERVDFAFLNAVSPWPWNDPKSVKEAVRVVLPDVSSPAVMGGCAWKKVRRLHINKADIMKHGLKEGCLGRRAFAEGKWAARTLRGMSYAPPSPDSQVGRWVRGLAQDVPMDDGAGAQVPIDVVETSRERNAEASWSPTK